MVRSLRVRGICESVPEARLQRLVRRQRFEEAEKLAKVLNLPVESVYQVRSSNLMKASRADAHLDLGLRQRQPGC